MAYDFPSSPTDGQTYTPSGGPTYVYKTANGGWRLQAEAAAGVAWTDITGKPTTFPPTLPIAESDVTNLVTDLAAKLSTATASATYAPLANPALTGTPTVPTATAGTNSTQIASTAFVTAAIAAAPSGGVTISDTAPGSPTNGMLWWQSSTGDLFIYYNDGTSSQWVQINTVGS